MINHASKRRLLAAVISAALTACAAPPQENESASEHTLRIATSIPPQAHLIETIGRGHVHVIALLKPGDDPHTFQPSDRQVSDVMRARVYFRTGVALEYGPWMRALASSGLRVVDLREGVALREIAAGHHNNDENKHGDHAVAGKDPHIWLAPRLLKTQAETIARTLGELDPDHAAKYEANLARLLEKIDAADAEIRRTLAPLAGRRVYVSHPAWGYFCRAYGLQQEAIERGGRQPSDHELTRLLEKARDDGVKTIFVHSQVAGRPARLVARAIGADVQVHVIDPLAEDVLVNLIAVARAFADAHQ